MFQKQLILKSIDNLIRYVEVRVSVDAMVRGTSEQVLKSAREEMLKIVDLAEMFRKNMTEREWAEVNQAFDGYDTAVRKCRRILRLWRVYATWN